MPDSATASVTPAAAPPGPEAPAGRVLFRLGSWAVTPRRLATILIAIAVLVAISLLWGRLDIEQVHARAKALPAAVVVAAISLLPLIGFPVSWLHLVAGVRFDFIGGMAVVAFASATHHFLGWSLVRVLPAGFFDRLGPWRARLAGAGHRDAAILCCLLPGMPYTVTLYLLPLIDVPLRILLGVSAVLHTCRAAVTILLGDVSDNLSPGKIALMAAYYGALFVVSSLALRRLKRALGASQIPKA